MSEYFSELLNTEECILHVKAKGAIKRNRYARMKVDPVRLERVLISLDQARQEIARLKAAQQRVQADLAYCSCKQPTFHKLITACDDCGLPIRQTANA